MKKGFTLIELLAVIVILAIIATIATPIVLSIINDAKESATLRSAEYYLDAVEQSIMKKNLTAGGSFNPNVCNVQANGDLLCDNKDTLEIEVNGEKPNGGNINFKKGVIEDVTLTLGEKNVSKNEKGELFSYVIPDKICSKAISPILGNVPSGEYAFGDEYVCKVNEDTSYNFIIVNSNGEYIYLLTINKPVLVPENEPYPGRNIINSPFGKSSWVTKEDFIEAGGTEKLWNADFSTYPEEVGKYTYGPVTALKYLDEVTKDWYYISNLNEYFTDQERHYTIYLSGKSRLLSDGEAGGFWRYFDLNSSDGVSLNTYLMGTAKRILEWDGLGYGEVADYLGEMICAACYEDPIKEIDVLPVIKVLKSKIAN